LELAARTDCQKRAQSTDRLRDTVHDQQGDARMVHQAATSLGQVRTQLRAMLKSDVAIDPLAPPAPGSFRNIISRAISMLDVHTGGEHASYLQLPVVPWTS
jgi:hypothetical protein